MVENSCEAAWRTQEFESWTAPCLLPDESDAQPRVGCRRSQQPAAQRPVPSNFMVRPLSGTCSGTLTDFLKAAVLPFGRLAVHRCDPVDVRDDDRVRQDQLIDDAKAAHVPSAVHRSM